MILILGSGGREEVIARQISKTHSVGISPGNGGSAFRQENFTFDLRPPYTGLVHAIKDRKDIDLVVIGPENYLSEGVVDVLMANGIPVFGPSQAATRLESSKAFAKEIMLAAGVATASYHEFRDLRSAHDFLSSEFFPEKKWVLKADGLCAGKGVIIPTTKEEALEALKVYFTDKAFGVAGERLIVEEFMPGEEASLLAFTDGKVVRCLPIAQDHKRVFDDDRGHNTGGMGVYSPVSIFRPGFGKRVENEILIPVIREMRKRGIPYRGVLYAGLMIEGESIRVVEFNVRFGDPECQCVLPLLESDLVEVMQACGQERLAKVDFRVSQRNAVCVVLSSEGYPEKYQTGKEIKGFDRIPVSEDGVNIEVFHAGTEFRNGKFFTAGGRVLSVCGYGQTPKITMKTVTETVYKQVEKIHFEGRHYRKDIGKKEMERFL